MNLIFDIETDGLLYNVTTIHCLAIHDLDTKETVAYNDTGNARTDFKRLAKTHRTRTALLVTTLLATTYLLFANSIRLV